MKTTLDLPDELMREIKIRAATHGRKLKDVMEETIRRGLSPEFAAKTTPELNLRKHPTLGFPMVDCGPEAPASRMSIDEILKLEQDALTTEDHQSAGLAI